MERVEAYFEYHGIKAFTQRMIYALCTELPQDPYVFISHFALERRINPGIDATLGKSCATFSNGAAIPGSLYHSALEQMNENKLDWTCASQVSLAERMSSRPSHTMGHTTTLTSLSSLPSPTSEARLVPFSPVSRRGVDPTATAEELDGRLKARRASIKREEKEPVTPESPTEAKDRSSQTEPKHYIRRLRHKADDDESRKQVRGLIQHLLSIDCRHVLKVVNIALEGEDLKVSTEIPNKVAQLEPEDIFELCIALRECKDTHGILHGDLRLQDLGRKSGRIVLDRMGFLQLQNEHVEPEDDVYGLGYCCLEYEGVNEEMFRHIGEVLCSERASYDLVIEHFEEICEGTFSMPELNSYADPIEEMKTQLLVASEEGNLYDVKRLLLVGNDPNLPDVNGTTPAQALLTAHPKPDHHEILQLLLKNNAQVIVDRNTKDADGGGYPGDSINLLHVAAKYGRTLCLSTLMKAGACIKHALTSALCADSLPNPEIVMMLLEAEASPDECCASGTTALCLAAQHHAGGCVALQCCETLLWYKASVNELSHGFSSLYLSAKLGNAALVRCLLHHDHDVDTLSAGTTPLEVASYEGYPQVVDILLEHSADVHKGYPLHFAAKANRIPVVERLLQARADANLPLPMEGNKSPLHLATALGHIDVCAFLLEAGARAELEDDEGYSSVITASLTHERLLRVLTGRQEERWGEGVFDKIGWAKLQGKGVIRGLLPCIKVNDVDGAEKALRIRPQLEKKEEGLTPLLWALKLGHYEIADLLLKAKADATARGNEPALSYCISREGVAICDKLLASGAKVNALGSNKNSPLHYALSRNVPNLARFFVEKKADVGILNRSGQSPIHLACKFGHDEILDIMLELNPKTVNQPTASRSPPLALGCAGSNPKIIEVLIKREANVNKPNAAEMTPLMIAADNGNPEMCRILLEAKADVDMVNRKGATAVSFARNDDVMMIFRGKPNWHN